ncbi:hypothetical protein SAMN05192550_1985 [Flavobacterium glycines]|uniref:Uncharacterized protein n=1 Tax=Flavobacterium glycines TaxID=551990 RepID=A0A1B9DGX5_9FLAO|nr:hypothetical protein [Flavobacterium glycines]OCB68972.1 hypothetical protein FBGL_15510 [Flavobacterium glycines]GEL11173.1 hypothetical protein FGL01_19120 [Flavobacterium glycines]SDJ35597.1 hypothetical protein SAMN05192550_1985 [Flavobacterium glycines]
MRNINSILVITLLFFVASIYGQKGFYVDKDYRIEKYQKEIIKVLIDGQWLEKKEKGEIIINNYSGSMGVTKCIEVFATQPKKDNVLLVRFYSLGSHALNYWGILEKESNYLFYYDEKDKSKIEDYLKKYDVKTQKILLDYVKIYTDWNEPNLPNSQPINEN